ncbi:MAG: ABC transporter permease [Defluviitaleaceae bacterium]|nr:ABC transporter permease [Defluviitaleaceae bacterium]MCL2837091.1 ABC transporter permease [Defluviitaleaceae bacterium]
MSKLKMLSKINIRDNIIRYFSFSTLIILLIFFSSQHVNFLGTANLRTLLSDSAPLLIMAAGMTSVLLLGSIDLSMGSVCSVANVITVMIINQFAPRGASPGLAAIIALVASIAFGAASGLLLGTVHVKFKVPSFIASLGFMSMWQSAALLITPAPVSIARVMRDSVEWYRVVFGVAGLPLILAMGWVAVVFAFQKKLALGRAIYAIGGNERAARIAGLSVDRTKITVFAVNGVCAALGGFFLAAKLRSSAPTVGDPFTLLIVASVALGGTSLIGGRGGVLGTVLGVFTVAVIENGMNFIGVDPYWQSIVFGLFILAAVAISIDRSARGLVVK